MSRAGSLLYYPTDYTLNFKSNEVTVFHVSHSQIAWRSWYLTAEGFQTYWPTDVENLSTLLLNLVLIMGESAVFLLQKIYFIHQNEVLTIL